MPRLIETVDEFRDRHGGDYIPLEGGKCLLFGTGAMLRWNQYAGELTPTMTHEPPEAPLARLKNQRRFHVTKRDMYHDAFTRFQAAYASVGDFQAAPFAWDAKKLGPDPGEPVAALKQLKAKWLTHKREADKIQKQIDALPETVAARKAREQSLIYEQAARERREEFLGRIQSIKLEDSDDRTTDAATADDELDDEDDDE